MRDIKFRYWDKEVCEMVAWEIILDDGFEKHLDDYLMQYTGLNDRDGVEIYEGDIVRFDAEDGMFGHDPVLGLIASVDWDNMDTGFFFNTDTDKYPYVKTYRGRNIEIIGNIYENPELLQKK